MTEDKYAPYQSERGKSVIPWAVHLAAYEVYCHVFSKQGALIDLEGTGCRGGFGENELFAFLYARSFPKNEWDQRFHEAIKRPK